MSVKVIDLATSKKKNENVQKKILQREKETKKHVFQSSSKPESPLLSDKSEFPSLSESLGRVSNYLPSSGRSLKYSDKLKSSSSSSRNHAPVFENVHFKCNTSSTDAYQCDDKINRSNFSSTNSRNKLYDNSKTKNISGKALNNSLNKSISSDNEVNHVEKKEWTKQKPVLKSKRESQNMAIKSSVCQSSDTTMLTKSSKQSNKPEIVGNKVSKEENATAQDSSKAKKKKARKSKIKRQVAMQSGKITFLTPEIHSKIQASLLNTQNSVNSPVVGNINDEEEYPELGKAVLPSSQKENVLKRNVPMECQVEDLDKSADYSVEKMEISGNIVAESPKIPAVEKKEKADKMHSHNPITISFYEMLLEKNAIKKETKELDNKTESPNVIGLSKLKNKKNVSHSLNLLDSSSPAVKRGKERENPKPKKPSQLKKIILLDRKARREHLLQMKNSSEGEIAESGLISEQHGEENNLLTSEKEDEDEITCEDDYLFFQEEIRENDETVSQLTESRDFCVQNELTSRMAQLNVSGETDNYKATSDLSSDFIEVVGKSTLASDKKALDRAENDSSMRSLTISQPDVDPRMHLNIPLSPESLLNTLTGMTCPDISDKERAVKILLHTRNFREYCNHLISKDIDDATYALLDDLARFQDRLHQKDPVKARMKRRMIYGVKEVKKHIKLRKLKCIIIAVDIENVETQGGLNDILNEIKVSAVDHHIPYVFALSRKVLGKVCRKPVPVSCVGVFNYEGSEANFKKMVELQSQSKADYTEIFNKLLVKITDEEVAALIKAKKEAPETLRSVRANILSDFFLPFDSVKSENDNDDLKSANDTSQLIETPT